MPDPALVFVVGKLTYPLPDLPDGRLQFAFEVQGVYTEFERARLACKDARWFVGPVPLDVALPESTVHWPGVEFPLGAQSPGSIEAPSRGNDELLAQRPDLASPW